MRGRKISEDWKFLISLEYDFTEPKEFSEEHRHADGELESDRVAGTHYPLPH